MPSNHILINNSLEYIVADSQMDDFLHWLNENGHVVNTGREVTSDIPIES